MRPSDDVVLVVTEHGQDPATITDDQRRMANALAIPGAHQDAHKAAEAEAAAERARLDAGGLTREQMAAEALAAQESDDLARRRDDAGFAAHRQVGVDTMASISADTSVAEAYHQLEAALADPTVGIEELFRRHQSHELERARIDGLSKTATGILQSGGYNPELTRQSFSDIVERALDVRVDVAVSAAVVPLFSRAEAAYQTAAAKVK